MVEHKKLLIIGALAMLLIAGIWYYYTKQQQRKRNSNSVTGSSSNGNGNGVGSNSSNGDNGGGEVTSPVGTNPLFPDLSQTDLGGSEVNLIIQCINSADPQPRTWQLVKGSDMSVEYSNTLQTGQTWEFKGIASGTYNFRVISDTALGEYTCIITVIGGQTINSTTNKSKTIAFTIP